MRPVLPFLIFALSLIGSAVNASVDALPAPAARLFSARWPASWVTAPSAPKNEYGVYSCRPASPAPWSGKAGASI